MDRETPDRTAAEPIFAAGELQLGVAARGDLRWAAVDLARPVEEARARLDLSLIAAVALGRALSAAVLVLRFTTKQSGRLLIEVAGDGPLKKIVAEADTEGCLRGLVGNPKLATPEDGSMAIGWAVGKGILRVTREGERSGRYTSQVELVTGELGGDLVHYLEQSQQIRSAAMLGVLPRPSGIAAAGGVLVEAFPGTPDDTVARLEANIAGLEGVSAYLDQGGGGALRDAVLEGFGREELERHTLAYRCRCSREGLLQQLRNFPGEDLDAIVDESRLCVAECAFCGALYRYRSEELRVN